MIKTASHSELSTSLELTPLIDIVFIVVVFLLLTANSRLLSLPVDIPASDSEVTAQPAADKPLTLVLQQSSPAFAIDEQHFEQWPAFKTALIASIRDNDKAVVIAADKNSPVEPLLKLLALLNAHQVENTQILMEESQP
ncbi:biopolymer transporter ExbD [Corallincola luteus]|uniref:Biopolymer transporter ExbD n=2 Tax=Corallincola TaxID=1775176 RepID=A0A368N7V5_9GAMM|nr:MULTISPECIES: biopolymer transporter ExbD [Corallincola]RCU45615.1 biopolymer transporter ExbD [Corallincola holothuriorum]TCI02267.1 biopolymer transporter ExbD [Corallincola luteus]